MVPGRRSQYTSAGTPVGRHEEALSERRDGSPAASVVDGGDDPEVPAGYRVPHDVDLDLVFGARGAEDVVAALVAQLRRQLRVRAAPALAQVCPEDQAGLFFIHGVTRSGAQSVLTVVLGVGRTMLVAQDSASQAVSPWGSRRRRIRVRTSSLTGC